MSHGEETRSFLPPREEDRGTAAAEYLWGRRQSRGSLRKLPETVLLKIAIHLDPDVVAEKYQEGWSKEDILQLINRHTSSAVGHRSIKGWPIVEGTEILELGVEEDL